MKLIINVSALLLFILLVSPAYALNDSIDEVLYFSEVFVHDRIQEHTGLDLGVNILEPVPGVDTDVWILKFTYKF